jgi:hypothetical protein
MVSMAKYSPFSARRRNPAVSTYTSTYKPLRLARFRRRLVLSTRFQTAFIGLAATSDPLLIENITFSATETNRLTYGIIGRNIAILI